MRAFFILALLAAPVASALAQTPPPATAERAKDPLDKVICKRFVETGSLVKGYRTCKTKREWQNERDDIRSGGPGVDSCANRANGGQC